MHLGSKDTNGPLIGSGVSPDEGLWVKANTPAAANVVVTSGSAMVHGVHYRNTADLVLSIAANTSGFTRIDTIILRKDWTAQTIRLVVKQGTPAASPVAPGLTLTDGVLWEIPLADITVADSFVSIANTVIKPNRHYTNAADGVYLLDILNNSGVTLETGDVVVWDHTADRAIKTTTTEWNPEVAGVWVGRTVAGGYGRVQVKGIGYVRTTAAVTTVGVPYVTSTTAKGAVETSYSVGNSSLATFARSLDTTGAAGICLMFIDAPEKRYSGSQVLKYAGGVITTNSAALVAIDAANVKVVTTSSSGKALVSFTGTFYQSSGTVSNSVSLALDVDGTVYPTGTSYMHLPVGSKNLLSYTILITGLAPGIHTFTPFWSINADDVGIVGSAAAPDILSVVEV
jgi:hypothetical protein